MEALSDEKLIIIRAWWQILVEPSREEAQWFKRVVINHGSQRLMINHSPTNSYFYGIASRRRLQFVMEYTSLLAGKINEPSAPCSLAMLLIARVYRMKMMKRVRKRLEAF